jgi:hypothetical protein
MKGDFQADQNMRGFGNFSTFFLPPLTPRSTREEQLCNVCMGRKRGEYGSAKMNYILHIMVEGGGGMETRHVTTCTTCTTSGGKGKEDRRRRGKYTYRWAEYSSWESTVAGDEGAFSIANNLGRITKNLYGLILGLRTTFVPRKNF